MDSGGRELSGTASPSLDTFLRDVARLSDPPAGSPPELLPGEHIGGYRILSKLGQGGMGAVYEVEDRTLGRRIALKVLVGPHAESEERRRRFMREVRSAAAVTHPNLAAIYGVGEDQGRAFIAMELVQGASLRDLLAAGSLPIGEAMRIARDVARGLAKAHGAGIVHRDLKPDNVMVAHEGYVKLLDFGLAKCTDPGALAFTEPQAGDFSTDDKGRVMGTSGYMSPEQARGHGVDVRSDVFSFGVMLYEMVTGQRAFKGRTRAELDIAVARDDPEPPSRVQPRTPGDVERIVLRCLRKDPEERYRSGAELLQDLERALPSSGYIGGGDLAPRDRAPTIPRRLALVAAVGGLVVTGALTAWVLRGSTVPTPRAPAPGTPAEAQAPAGSSIVAAPEPGPSATASPSPGASASTRPKIPRPPLPRTVTTPPSSTTIFNPNR